MQRYVGIVLVVAALLQTGTPRPPDSGDNGGKQIVNEDDSNEEEYGKNYWSEGWSTKVTEGACKYSLERLRQDLSNQSEWAFQMMESSALAMSGLIFGSTHQLGNYEECMDIKEPFWGKYCLAKVHLDWKEGSFLKEGTVWNKIWNSTRKKYMIRREWMTWAICIPSVCDSADARAILSTYLQPMRDSLHVRRKGLIVEDVSCRTMDPEEIELHPEWYKSMTRGQLIMTVFFFGLVTMVTWATIYEEWFYSRAAEMKIATLEGNTVFNDSKDALWERIVLCFSIRRNWYKLSKKRPEGKPPGTFDAVHGIKTSTMMLVTIGHRNFFTLGAPMFNSQYIEHFFTRPDTAILMGGTILVDTFFFISGCLLLHGVLEERMKMKPIKSLILMALRRYLRLVPVLMVIVAFYSTLFPRIGSGPVWEATIGAQRDNCRDNWWTNLLLLQTFVRPETMCVIQSWYVAVEFHAFILCAPVALFYRSQRRLGTWILIAATSLSMIVPFILTMVYHLDALLMPFISVLQDLSKDPTFLRVYIPTYMRTIPYFLGMLCALAIRRQNKKKLKLSKGLVVAGHVISFAIFILSCYSPWIFFRPDAPDATNPLAAASFSVFTRCAWSLALSWQMFSSATSNGWWIGRVMAWRPLAPFGRLTYGAFLTHAAIQLYDVSSTATPRNITVFYMITSIVSDFFVSHFLAMILFLGIEAPIAALEKVMLNTGTVVSAKGGISRDDSEDHKTSDFSGCIDHSNLLNMEKSQPMVANRNKLNHLLQSEA